MSDVSTFQMDRTRMDYSSRRTSSRTRHAPDRYGGPVTNEELFDFTNSSRNSTMHSQTRRINNVAHSSTTHQSGTIMNRSNISNNSIVGSNVLPNISHNTSVRDMPVFANYTNQSNYVNRNFQAKNIDFPMVSMNSYEIVEVLCSLAPFIKGGKNDRYITQSVISQYENNSNYKFFIRFCKFEANKKTQQLDCLPKCFMLTTNGESVQIKTKYSGNPYEITCLITKKRDVSLRVSIPDPVEQCAQFHFGIVAVKKVDLRNLIDILPNKPHDSFSTINIVKKLLEHDDDLLLEGGEENNKLTVSLRCPFSTARLKNPVRSIHCRHVACFDLQSFIEMNRGTPKWRCPHCREYIVVSDLIVDGLLVRILKDAPKNANEAYIDVMGRYTYDVRREPVIPVSVPIKRENISPETVPENIFFKKQKTDIECITLSGSDTEEEHSLSPSRNNSKRCESVFNTNSALSSNSESSEDDAETDDDCEIIFEKPPISSTNISRTNDFFRSHSNIASTSNVVACSISNVAKPVPMHVPQPSKSQQNSCTSILDPSGSNYNEINQQNILPSTKLVHSFYKTSPNNWHQKMSIRPTNSTMNSLPQYGIYQDLPATERPIFHPSYTNQPNIFHYSNSAIPYRTQHYHYPNSAFSSIFRDTRQPAVQQQQRYNDNSIQYGHDRRPNTAPSVDINCPYPNEQSSGTNFHLPQMDPSHNL